MDEENVSRQHAHPMQAAATPRAVGIPEQRSSIAPETGARPSAAARPMMNLARLTLAVIFAMLLIGLVASFILTRS
jgi:hypothetical protein